MVWVGFVGMGTYFILFNFYFLRVMFGGGGIMRNFGEDDDDDDDASSMKCRCDGGWMDVWMDGQC